jgi:hypothetical protein
MKSRFRDYRARLVGNAAPDQPRDANGRWTRTGEDTAGKSRAPANMDNTEFEAEKAKIWQDAMSGKFGGGEAMRRIDDLKKKLGVGTADPDARRKIPQVTVVHYSGEQTYHLSDKAIDLRVSSAWKSIGKAVLGRYHGEEDDLLVAADGLRPGSFVETTDPNLHDKLNKLFKKHGLDAVAYPTKGPGVAVVRGDNVDHKDREKFVSLVGKQLTSKGGHGSRSSLTEDEHALLGVWLGYPKASTKKYVKGS